MDGRHQIGLSGVHAVLRGVRIATAVIAVAVVFLPGVVRAEGVADDLPGVTDAVLPVVREQGPMPSRE